MLRTVLLAAVCLTVNASIYDAQFSKVTSRAIPASEHKLTNPTFGGCWQTTANPKGSFAVTVTRNADDFVTSWQASRTGYCRITGTALPPPPPPTTGVVTYVNGPHGCTTRAGYQDAPVCTPPNTNPTDSFPLPAIGGTYMDANFGGQVTLLSGQNSTHGYSNPSAFSATGKYVAAAINGEQVDILNALTGQVLFRARPGNVTADTLRWDAYNDDFYYVFSGPRIMRHQLSTNQMTAVVDFTGRFTTIGGGGTGDTSKDNWLAFWAPTEHQVCITDLSTTATYCGDYLASAVVSRVGITFVDFVLSSKGVDTVSGKRYVLLMANPAIAVFSVDLAGGQLQFEHRGGELPGDMSGNGNRDGICDTGERCMQAAHSDTFEDSDGQQYLITNADLSSPCARTFATFRLRAGTGMPVSTASGGGRTTNYVMQLCGDLPWTAFHFGCAKNAPYCVMESEGPIVRTASTTATYPFTPHLGEVMVTRGNLVELRRVALHRSIHWSLGNVGATYWTSPRACISGDGRRVLWDSNFGRLNGGTFIATALTGF